MSPALLGLYINDLITDVKALNVDDIIIFILAFSDDTVILAKNEKYLQDILNCVENWCNKWRFKVNTDKTNVMHFRGKHTNCTKFNFKFDHNELAHHHLQVFNMCMNKNIVYIYISLNNKRQQMPPRATIYKPNIDTYTLI